MAKQIGKVVVNEGKDQTTQCVGKQATFVICVLKLIKDNLLDISLMKNAMFLTQKIQFYWITLL